MRSTDNQERKRITGSISAKVVAYFLLAISFFIGGIAIVLTGMLATRETYSYGTSLYGLQAFADNALCADALEDARNFYNLRWSEDSMELQELLENYCKNKNIQMEVYRSYDGEDAKLFVGNYDGMDTPFVYSRTYMEYERIEEERKEELVIPEVSGSGAILLEEQQHIGSMPEPAYRDVEVYYEITVYVNPQFPIYDRYAVSYGRAVAIWEQRNILPVVALTCILVFIFSFVFLMCGAGHKNGKTGITPSVLTGIYLDLLTAIFGVVALFGIIFVLEMTYGYSEDVFIFIFILVMTAVVVWCTIYCGELALRFKLGNWWKHSLIYVLLRFIGRGICFCGKSFVAVIKGLPLIVNTLIIFMGVCIVEFVLFLTWGLDDAFTVWVLEKLLLFPIVMYIALACKKLQRGSKALAEGNLNYKLDTSKMVFALKEHGENLNQIGQGISKAVEERMKSEHLKTELITNVSHDLKTPLTSIINYADLLGNAANTEAGLNREKVAEYSEVLLRQSRRLKKLLEDLVEASKATTGNLEVVMAKCEVGVLLSQAVGEYEQRFWDRQLEAIVRVPEEQIWIMADGRRLWRVFDNLLNNICKYAQENTRVYLTVAPREGAVEIIFRNMSKYALELTGEELEERFVRGDKSRHMEGNGLGLSIAKSLVELQNGSMEIVTDGDLFKVTLRFPILE